MSNKNSINKIIGLIVLIVMIMALMSFIAFAIPNSLTLQGKLTNLAGSSQVGTFNFTFKIYDNVTNGNELWAVINQSVTTDSNGVYDTILTGLNLSFAEQYYLGIAVQGENESTPRINLTSAPYSFRANTSESLNPNASYFVANLSVGGHATIGNGSSIIEISTQRFNVTISGNLIQAGNITLGNQIVFRLGEIIDNLVDGWLKVTGALNVTSSLVVGAGANITGDLTVNNTFNVTASSGNVNVGGILDAGNVRILGSNVQVEANAFKISNYSSEYDSTGFKRANVSDYLGGADVNASLIKSTNTTFLNLFSRVADAFSRANLTDFFGDSGFNGSVLRVGNISNIRESLYNLANFTSNYDARSDRFGNANFSSNLNSANFSLWNTTFGNTTQVYTRDANARVLIGSLNLTAVNLTEALVVVGNVNVSGYLNISGDLIVNKKFNVTASSGNVNVEGTISAGGVISSRGQELQQEVNAFKRANVTDFLGVDNASIVRTSNLSVFGREADAFKISNYSSEYASTGYKLANFTSNLNTQNASLWNRSSTNTVLRFNDDRVGIGTTSPGQALHVVGSSNISATVNAPVVNTTLATQNITITSAAGSVIIRLG